MLQAPDDGDEYSSASDRNEEEEDEEPANKRRTAAAAAAAAAPTAGFHSFAPKAQGVLFKISPLSKEVSDDIEAYMRNGAMQRDLVFVDTLYGIVAPSQSREYSMFWESPWVEEQIKETGKKRKIEAQQRTMAVRSFIKASTSSAQPAQDAQDVDRFLHTVDRLAEWDRQTASMDDTVRESVKTVSRMVQSFEKKAVMTLLSLLQSGSMRSSNSAALHHLQRLRNTATSDIDSIAHSLRRSPHTYIAFASLVAAELVLSEANSGSKNISINTARRMDQERFHCVNTMLDVLNSATPATLPKDTLGLPLMQTNSHICISKGVLVVANQNATQATYILEIENLDEILQHRTRRANKGLDVLEITAQIFEEADAASTIAKQTKTKGSKRKGVMMMKQSRDHHRDSGSRALASLV